MIIPFCSDLFFEDGTTINQYHWEQTRFLSLVLLNYYDNFVKEIREVLKWYHLFHYPLSLFVCILRVSSEYLEEMKLIDIVNWIFHSPNWVSLLEWTLNILGVLWSFIILLKYGLILSKYSLGDKFLSLSSLLWYSMQLPLKALLVFIGL